MKTKNSSFTQALCSVHAFVYLFKRTKHFTHCLPQGLRNDFKDAMDKVDQQYLEEMVKAQGEDVPSSAYDIKFQDDGLTLEELIEMSQDMMKGDEAVDSKVILSYIKVG